MNVLVAVDFSQVTDAIRDLLIHWAAQGKWSVTLVHVAEPEPEFVGWEAGPAVVRSQVAGELRSEHRDLDALAATLRQAGVATTALHVQGAIVDTILAQADKHGAGLIVVGSHGHGATYDLLVGSISSGVIRRAKLPVLVVPSVERNAG